MLTNVNIITFTVVNLSTCCDDNSQECERHHHLGQPSAIRRTRAKVDERRSVYGPSTRRLITNEIKQDPDVCRRVTLLTARLYAPKR